MWQVCIYGPPGVGKLSVARELAFVTGFRLLDNHTTIDTARRLFDFGTPPFWRLESKVRDAMIEAALAERVSFISTFVVASAAAQGKLRGTCQQMEAIAGRCCFVRLTCDQTVLEERLVAAGRREAGKLTSVDRLRDMLP